MAPFAPGTGWACGPEAASECAKTEPIGTFANVAEPAIGGTDLGSLTFGPRSFDVPGIGRATK
jgi:hypothetical protein